MARVGCATITQCDHRIVPAAAAWAFGVRPATPAITLPLVPTAPYYRTFVNWTVLTLEGRKRLSICSARETFMRLHENAPCPHCGEPLLLRHKHMISAL